jgi:uncharacterized protein (DUF983 family)
MNQVAVTDSFGARALMLWRGAKGRCPKCGEGRVLHRYLKIVPNCSVCDEALGHLPADDMPPWLTILIVGHILFPNVWHFERAYTIPVWMEMVLWPSLGLALTLLLLPRCKGFVVALLWMLRRQKA